ncbi:MAG: hypothetical protein KC910_35995, partial [Candidatus Eremiobacteraeota bacterium]|nr:hypothetical protein [Candidatus Eremiobacteraeota bacterium]
TCPAGNCAACPVIGLCSDCGQSAPDNCPSSVGRCVCLSNRDISVSSNCAGDIPATPLKLCVDVKATANQRVVADCSLARSQTGIDPSATTLTLCDGSPFNVMAGEYWCCMTCFAG